MLACKQAAGSSAVWLDDTNATLPEGGLSGDIVNPNGREIAGNSKLFIRETVVDIADQGQGRRAQVPIVVKDDKIEYNDISLFNTEDKIVFDNECIVDDVPNSATDEIGVTGCYRLLFTTIRH